MRPDRLLAAVRTALPPLLEGHDGARVLVAVSGGADSTALAVLLAEVLGPQAPTRLVLGHVEHGWRGEKAAAADRAVVRALGARLGLPVRHATPSGSAPPVGRTEAAARQHRYRALTALALEGGADVVATGHHLGDQAETLCLRAARGSGPHGLAGIPASRPLHGGRLRVIRPLLGVAPQALRVFLRERGVPWSEDTSNQDPRHDRVRMRAALAAEGAPPTERLAAFCARMRARLDRREARVLEQVAPHVRWRPLLGAVEVPRSVLVALERGPFEQVLRWLGAGIHAEAQGPWLNRRLLAQLRVLLHSGGALDLPRRVRLHARGPRAWLYRRRDRIPVRGDLVWQRRQDLGVEAPWARAPGEVAFLSADAAGPRPVLRRLREDDRFHPLGRGGPGEVAVMDWLARRGTPAFARARTWVVEAAGAVAWVVDERVDRRFAVTPATRRVWRIEVRTARRRPAGLRRWARPGDVASSNDL
jgi:tRNA(Ile)-lysidine synthase